MEVRGIFDLINGRLVCLWVGRVSFRDDSLASQGAWKQHEGIMRWVRSGRDCDLEQGSERAIKGVEG